MNTANNYGGACPEAVRGNVLGNLTRDTREQIDQIDRTVAGKVKSVTRTVGSTLPALTFGYGAHGHRIWKKNLQTGNTTFYVHDAQWNLMATYEAKPALNSLALSEPILPPGLSTRMSRLGNLVKEDPEALSVQRRRVPKPKVGSLLWRPCAREEAPPKQIRATTAQSSFDQVTMRFSSRFPILILCILLLAVPLMGQDQTPQLSASLSVLPPLVDGKCKYVQFWFLQSKPLRKYKIELRSEIHLHEKKILCKRRRINETDPVVHLYEYDPAGRVSKIMNMFPYNMGNVFSYEYHDSFVEVRNTTINDSTLNCFHGTWLDTLDDGIVFYETAPKDSMSYLILPDRSNSTQGHVVRSVFHGPSGSVRKDFDRNGIVIVLDSNYIIDESSYISYLELNGTYASKTFYVRVESMEEEYRSALIKRMRRKYALKNSDGLCLVYCSDRTAFTKYGPYGAP